MSALEHSIREVDCPDGKSAAIVSLTGSVNPESIDDFDAIFDELIEQQKVRVIMDVANLKYINSTGMGMMVQYYDQLVEEGGGLVLLSVSAKIILVLEMLGLQELFPIVSSEADALAALLGQSTESSEVEVKIAEKAGAGQFLPTTVTCEACGAELKVGGSGKFICPRCQAALAVDTKGQTQTCLPESASTVELSIPAQVPFFKSAAALALRVGIRAGMPEAAIMEAAATVQAALAALTANCLCGAQHEKLQLIACASNNEFTVSIFCFGAHDVDSDKLTEQQKGFDSVNHERLNGGNILLLQRQL